MSNVTVILFTAASLMCLASLTYYNWQLTKRNKQVEILLQIADTYDMLITAITTNDMEAVKIQYQVLGELEQKLKKL